MGFFSNESDQESLQQSSGSQTQAGNPTSINVKGGKKNTLIVSNAIVDHNAVNNSFLLAGESLGFGRDSLEVARDSLHDSLDFGRDSLAFGRDSLAFGRDSARDSLDFASNSLWDSLSFGRDSVRDSLDFGRDSLAFGRDSYRDSLSLARDALDSVNSSARIVEGTAITALREVANYADQSNDSGDDKLFKLMPWLIGGVVAAVAVGKLRF